MRPAIPLPPAALTEQAEPATPSPAEPAIQRGHRVLQQVRIAFIAVKSHLQQAERQAGATGAQVWALHAIRRLPGIGVTTWPAR